MTLSDWINLGATISSLVLSGISIVFVILTLRQNNKMIENATRPYVTVKYEAMILPQGMERYVVVKNCGQTSAQILQIVCTGNAKQEYLERVNMLGGTCLAPGQRVIYYFGGSNPNMPETITVFCKYKGTRKREYQEETTIRLVVGTFAKRSKSDEALPYALQEIAERLL